MVLSRLGADVRRSPLIPVVCMQTIAANLGSMLTPIGNPQNLYLYGKSGMSIGGFVLPMLPYTLVSLFLLLAWAAMVCRKASAALSVDELVSSSASQGDQKIILLYLVLFAICLLSVIRVLPYGIAFAAVLVCALFADPHTLRAVDYSLLLTFVAFFIFIAPPSFPHTVPFALVSSGYLIRSYNLPKAPRSCVPASSIPRCTYLSHLLLASVPKITGTPSRSPSAKASSSTLRI